ncbi:uncharacterized protein TNIN_104421 [Trichonephila inaurata madagascariensis]|uniref:Uncharacterized protein n=1 Tax=Trichonephila inaurata madagascariensis TaxID=2747483 RepID=A0A8X6JSE6_9ARAC|nr:uncharacterized protein TNIN_104421 [Trichonephila inaurata madagascariensis]
MWFKILLPHQHYPLAAMVGKDGKLYFRLVDVGALLGRSKVYEFAKRFDNLVIQGKDVLPAHKRYPLMTQRSKLVTPDVVFNILNAELSSLATSFATSLNVGFALVVNPGNLFMESYKTSPVLHVQDSPMPNSVLVRKWIQDFIQKVQDIRRIQHGSSLRMVYEAFLRAGADIRPRVSFASARCTGQKRRTAVMRSTYVASYDTSTRETPAPLQSPQPIEGTLDTVTSPRKMGE